jgi:hypothetical protein
MSAEPLPNRHNTYSRIEAAVRAALIIAIVVAGWRVGRSYIALFKEWHQLGRPVASVSASRLDAFPAVLPLAGQWSFADSDWNIRTQSKSTAQVAALFESLAATSAAENSDELPDLDPQLGELIEKFQITPVEKNGNRVYKLDQRDMKAQLVVRDVAGRARMIGFAVAFAQPSGNWQSAEFTPSVPHINRDATLGHLLPLPAEARRHGGRYDDAGRLLMELVEIHRDADRLLAEWRTAGWDVRPTGMGTADDFSYLCARGDEMVYAWSAEPPGALENLMLVRSPAPSDTKAK